MTHPYDPQNIFARILRGEIPNRTVLETTHTLGFHDISPQAPVHVLVIPKGAYATFDDFALRGSADEIADFHRVCARVVGMFDLGQGYRVISNAGGHGRQEVPHYHLHILGGRDLGPMLAKG
jgi:histidine triad (HIT) family protein